MDRPRARILQGTLEAASRVASRSAHAAVMLFFASASSMAFASPAAQSASEPSSVKVIPLDCGRIAVTDMDPFADNGSYRRVAKQLMVSCYLIRHPKGDLLWDAGIGDQFAGRRGVALLPGFIAHVPVTLASQLQRLGTRVDRIGLLAFSHEHIDHIGNANALTGATWLLNPVEHRWTTAQDGKDGLPPPLLARSSSATVRWIDADDYDVFGDGTVRIIKAPGHTPGHQILFVRPATGAPIILAGDLWHTWDNYSFNRVPRFNVSREDTLASMKLVRDLAARYGARIVLGHSPEDFLK